MINSWDRVVNLIENGFGHPRVLVVGDVMLDKYVCGEVERISPEAPVPILRIRSQSERPGGAANVAMNLAGLGAHVTVMGFGGGDADLFARAAGTDYCAETSVGEFLLGNPRPQPVGRVG